MTSTTQSGAVRLDVTADVPVEHAFRVFTERFDQIKPREHNLLGAEAIAETVFETRVGGHVYDRGVEVSNDQLGHLAEVAARDRPSWPLYLQRYVEAIG